MKFNTRDLLKLTEVCQVAAFKVTNLHFYRFEEYEIDSRSSHWRIDNGRGDTYIVYDQDIEIEQEKVLGIVIVKDEVGDEIPLEFKFLIPLEISVLQDCLKKFSQETNLTKE